MYVIVQNINYTDTIYLYLVPHLNEIYDFLAHTPPSFVAYPYADTRLHTNEA